MLKMPTGIKKNPKGLRGWSILYLCSRQTVGSHNAREESSRLVRGGLGGWRVPSHTHADRPAPACSDLEGKRESVCPPGAEATP